jgi:hypothetical protein
MTMKMAGSSVFTDALAKKKTGRINGHKSMVLDNRRSMKRQTFMAPQRSQEE